MSLEGWVKLGDVLRLPTFVEGVDPGVVVVDQVLEVLDEVRRGVVFSETSTEHINADGLDNTVGVVEEVEEFPFVLNGGEGGLTRSVLSTDVRLVHIVEKEADI